MNILKEKGIIAKTWKPKTVFLMDGLGASLTSFLLVTVPKYFSEYFGMPQEALTLLSALALIFAIYSFSCFAFLGNNAVKLLKPIIIANLSYCALTLGLVIYFYNELTGWDLAYFLGEILIICGLVYIEVKTLKQLGKIRGFDINFES